MPMPMSVSRRSRIQAERLNGSVLKFMLGTVGGCAISGGGACGCGHGSALAGFSERLRFPNESFQGAETGSTTRSLSEICPPAISDRSRDLTAIAPGCRLPGGLQLPRTAQAALRWSGELAARYGCLTGTTKSATVARGDADCRDHAADGIPPAGGVAFAGRRPELVAPRRPIEWSL